MTDSNAKSVKESRSNEGKMGGQCDGWPLILIHHVIAKAETDYLTPVECFAQSVGQIVIVAFEVG
jgi:hypothetical protein